MLSSLVLQWLQLEAEISRRNKELEVFREQRRRVEEELTLQAREKRLINRTIRTTSGKKVVFHERAVYEPLNQKFLKRSLQAYFSKERTSPPTAEEVFQHILKDRCVHKIVEVLQKM